MSRLYGFVDGADVTGERPLLPLIAFSGCHLLFGVRTTVEKVPALSPSSNGIGNQARRAGWRDYGPRVGIWRMMDVFDDVGIPVSAIINSDASLRYERLVQAGNERGWAWVAHGRSNSEFHVGMSLEEGRIALAKIIGDVEQSAGHRPKGWLGPALTRRTTRQRF